MPLTLVLVDGDPDCRDIFGTLLEHHGYRVHRAPDAAEGLRLARAFRPDLIIRDHPSHLPDGSTLAGTLKADPGTSSIPIVTITSRVIASELEAALQDHSLCVLTKPIRPSKLVRMVEILIGAPGDEPDGPGLDGGSVPAETISLP